jgi:hypothetical protein
MSGATSSKGRVATGNQAVSWSQHPRLLGLPLNLMECGKSQIPSDLVVKFQPFDIVNIIL